MARSRTHPESPSGASVPPDLCARVGALVLARHGRTVLNAERRLRGHLDPPLDAIGHQEARALAATFFGVRVRRVVSSPLRRAVQTAAAVASPAGVDVFQDRGLIDRDYGSWAGDRPTAVIEQWGSLDAAPGVEPSAEVTARARAALDRQVPYLDAGLVVLVAHDVVNRLLLADLDPGLGPAEGIAQVTACWNLLSWDADHWQVERVGVCPS